MSKFKEEIELSKNLLHMHYTGLNTTKHEKIEYITLVIANT